LNRQFPPPKGPMNQRQWLPIPDAGAFDASRIKKVNIAVVAAPSVVVALLGLLVGRLWLVVVPLIGMTVLVALTMRAMEGVVLGRLRATEADDDAHARIINVVDGLCVVSGDRRPRILVVEDASLTALAVPAGKEPPAIVVTTALLDQLDRLEIEAVAAHMLWRLRSGETEMTTYAIALTKVLGRIGLGAVASRIVERLLADKNELWADVAACQATRYPPAMMSALHKCGASGPGGIDPLLGPLMFVNHVMGHGDATASDGLPKVGNRAMSVDDRIAVLKEI